MVVAEAVEAPIEVRFEEFSRNYRSRFVGYFRRMGCNLDDAEDLTQETFFKAFRGLQEFREESSFYTWIYTIARNLLKDSKRRKNKARLEIPFTEYAYNDGLGVLEYEELTPVHGNNEESDQQALSSGLEAQVRKAVNSISPNHRRAFELRAFEEMPYKDIAETLGIPVNTVKTKVNRARAHLRGRLRPHVPA